MDPEQPLLIEEYSTGDEVDVPPLSEFWDKNVKIISDVMENDGGVSAN